ncbi:VOC family protein [Oceanobacillus sojae]|uniref:VOC family protein n=1 Tax=Oceanobacillus sojae TaxID=582851 RepID=UPI0009883094|nr:VOC family protein [Oceanobacillus sojae]MCT1902651.1 VOC family protein [Oceanobacillus sojae]
MEKKFFETQAIHVSDITIQVTDLQQSIEFYQDFLGFQVMEETDNKAMLSADGKKALINLEQPEEVVPKQRRTTGLYHFAILLPARQDLADFLKHLLQAGRAYSLQLGAADHLVSEALYFQDPDGNGIEVAKDRLSEGWDWSGKSVQMSTDPLDADGLLKSAEAWNGMPEETLIGHVHLHVNDLLKAKKFYVEGLGFQEVTTYPEASFLSDSGYHHHIAINTWNGEGAPTPYSNETGLKFFTIVYPVKEEAEKAKERLETLGYLVDEGMVKDPAGNQIFLSDSAK